MPKNTFQKWLDKVAIARIRQELVRVNGDRNRAADSLGVERTTLYRFLLRMREQEDADTDAHIASGANR